MPIPKSHCLFRYQPAGTRFSWEFSPSTTVAKAKKGRLINPSLVDELRTLCEKCALVDSLAGLVLRFAILGRFVMITGIASIEAVNGRDRMTNLLMQRPCRRIRATLMKSRILIQILLVVWAGKGLAAAFDISLISGHDYKVDNYIRAAMSLQAIGQEAACQTLLGMHTNGILDKNVFALCRMLFTQRGTNEFRAPLRHGFGDYLAERREDWPLNPIELVDGIPFCIAVMDGWSGAGPSESSEEYVRYCMTKCDWSTHAFHVVTAKQKSDALAKLLSLKQVRQPVSEIAKKFFAAQIE